MLLNKQIKIGNLVGFKPESRTFETSSALPISDHYIGIEIEAENINVNLNNLSTMLSYWDVVTDGSLRNNGAEFITGKLRGKDIENALNELTTIFTEFNIVPIYSDRTSVHIHADIRGLILESLQKVILSYSLVEPYWFKYLRHNRSLNAYCVPWYKSNSQLNICSKILQIEEVNTETNYLRSILGVSPKYAALNLGAIVNKGTIEFRHHYGTHNTQALLKWISTILYLIDNIKQYSISTILSTINQGGTYNLVQELSPYIDIPNDHICRMNSHRNIIALSNPNTNRELVQNELHKLLHGENAPDTNNIKKNKKFLDSESIFNISSSIEMEETLNRINSIPVSNRRR